MFYGTYIAKIDDKSRLYIPSPFRKLLKEKKLIITFLDPDTLVLTINNSWTPESVLNCYDLNTITEEQQDLLIKYINLTSTTCEIDKEGRISIPLSFRSQISFKNICTIIGKGESIAISNKEKYDKLLERMSEEIKKINTSSLNLIPRKKTL